MFVFMQTVLGWDFDNVWLQVPLIIGIPLIFQFVLTSIKSSSAERKPGNEIAVDNAMDMTILATGSCSSIFANPVLLGKFHAYAVVYGFVVLAVNIWIMSILSGIRRWDNITPVSNGKARRNSIVGFIPIGLVSAILIFGYTYKPKH